MLHKLYFGLQIKFCHGIKVFQF